MMTTGTVGGWSCGRVVSSSRGMAIAWARAGCKERQNDRNVKMLPDYSVTVHSIQSAKSRASFVLCSSTVSTCLGQII